MWDDFHMIKDKDDFELQILAEEMILIADILSDLKEVNK